MIKSGTGPMRSATQSAITNMGNSTGMPSVITIMGSEMVAITQNMIGKVMAASMNVMGGSVKAIMANTITATAWIIATIGRERVSNSTSSCRRVFKRKLIA